MKHFFRHLVLLVGVFALWPGAGFSQLKAEAVYEANGNIRVGSTQLSMTKSGKILITNIDGDIYTAHLSLSSRKVRKWFTGKQLENPSLVFDEKIKRTTFTGTIPEKYTSDPVQVKYTLGISHSGNAQIELNFIAGKPIEKILLMSNLHIHAPRTQIAGHQFKIDGKIFNLKKVPTKKDTASHQLFFGNPKEIQTLYDTPSRTLILLPKHIKEFRLADYNVTSQQPYVEWRFVPLKNKVVFEVSVSSEALSLAESQLKEGLDGYWAGVNFKQENHYEVPNYGLTNNLIPNGGFEQDLKYWQFASLGSLPEISPKGGFYFVDTKNQYQGMRCLKVLVRKNQVPCPAATFAIPVKVNGTYTISFYAKTDLNNLSLRVKSTTGIWPNFINWGNVGLTHTWKRYHFTAKVPNGALNIEFGFSKPLENGNLWIDAVQLEEGSKLSEYSQPSVLPTLLTNQRDKFFAPNQKINARIRLNGPPDDLVSLEVNVTGFDNQTITTFKKKVLLEKNGQAIVPVKNMEHLPVGFYLVKMVVTGSDGKLLKDYNRLIVMPFLTGNRKHKKIFSVGAMMTPRRGNLRRRFERWQRIGIGAAIYVYQMQKYLIDMHKKYDIFAFKSIFKNWIYSGDIDVSKNYHLDAEQLQQVEKNAYKMAKTMPDQKVWKTFNEPSRDISPEDMRAMIQVLSAVRRGLLRARPDAIMLSPDPSNMYPQSGSKWIELFIKEGGLKVCDIIAIHPYRPQPESPSLDQDTISFLNMLDRNGYHGDVWFTEGIYHQNNMLPSYRLNVYRGVSTDHWRVGAFSYDLGLGERMCLAFTMRSWLVALKYADRIKMSVDWGLAQNIYLDVDMTPTLSNFASNTLGRLLGNSTYLRTIMLGIDLHCELFDDGEGSVIAVLWSSNDDVNHFRTDGPVLDISNISTSLSVYNILGTKQKKTLKTIELSPYPVFLKTSLDNIDDFVAGLSKAPLHGKQFQPLQVLVKLKDSKNAKIIIKNTRSESFKGRVSIVNNTIPPKAMNIQDVKLKAEEAWELGFPLDWKNKSGVLPLDLTVKFNTDKNQLLLEKRLKTEVIRVAKLLSSPTIDARLNDWPVGSEIPLENRFKTFKSYNKKPVKMPRWSGPKDLSAKLLAGWNKTGLYLALKVRDNIHNPSETSINAFNFDSVQLYFDGWQDGREHPKFGFDNNDQSLDLIPLKNGINKVIRTVAPEQQLGFLKTGLNKKIQFAFRRTNDGYSIYEILIPSDQLAPIHLQEGQAFGFALLVNDNDGRYRKRGLTITPDGTEPYSHPNLYPIMVLE